MIVKNKMEEEIEKLSTLSERKEFSLREKAKKWLVIFFMSMILFTWLSRIADSVTIAKVTVDTIKSGNLNFHFSGEGTIEACVQKTVGVLENIRVDMVFAEQGKAVEAGEALFALNIEDLKEKKYILENEIKKLETDLKMESIATEKYMIPEQEAALILLENANKDLESIKKEEAFKIETVKINLEDARKKLEEKKDDYQSFSHITMADLEKEKQEAYDLAKQNYDENCYTAEQEIKEAERAVQDQKKLIRRLKNEDNQGKIQYAMDLYNDAAEREDKEDMNSARDYLNKVLYGEGGIEDRKNQVSDAETQLKRFHEDLELRKTKWETTLKEKENKLLEAEKELEEAKSGTYDIQKELKAEQEMVDTAQETVKTMERAMEEALYRRQEAIEQAERKIQEAEIAVEQAKKKDENTVQNIEKEQSLSMLRKEKIKIELEEKRKEEEEVNMYLKAEGIIDAPEKGVVSFIGIGLGKRTTSEDAMIISAENQGSQFRGFLKKEEANYIALGDEMSITLKGRKNKLFVKVESLKFLSEKDQAEIIAKIPEGSFISGMTADFEVSKRSDSYPNVISLQAVREDIKGKYILIMQQRDGILGKEWIAARREINILDKDATKAVVEGTFTNQDKMIISSNKEIGEGDRIRLMEQ